MSDGTVRQDRHHVVWNGKLLSSEADVQLCCGQCGQHLQVNSSTSSQHGSRRTDSLDSEEYFILEKCLLWFRSYLATYLWYLFVFRSSPCEFVIMYLTFASYRALMIQLITHSFILLMKPMKWKKIATTTAETKLKILFCKSYCEWRNWQIFSSESS